MKINRITIDILSGSSNRIISPKSIGPILRYCEDIILHHLKKRTDLGGFGYLHTRLYDDNFGESIVKPYGQIVEVHHKNEPIDIDSILDLNDNEKLNLFFDYTEKSIVLVEKELKLEGFEIIMAIKKARETGTELKEKYDQWWKNYFEKKN